MDRVTAHIARSFSGAVLLKLVDLISTDQLLILDNVISENIIHVIEHQKYMAVPLQIDTLPCDIRVDDILTALMRLLPWVCIYIRTYFTS